MTTILTRTTTGTGHERRDGEGGGTAARRGRRTAVAAVVTGIVMFAAARLPSGPGNLVNLLQTFLPWLGLGVPLLLVLAAVRRAPAAAVAALVPAVTWCFLFGGLLTDKRADGGDMTMVSQNVHDANPNPRGTARALAASGAELLALQELTSRTAPAYEKALADTYPYHAVRGTVGLWSTYPLRDPEPVAIMPWTRALRATVATPKGPLAEAVRAEPLPRVVVAGDFNGTPDDTSLRPLTGELRSAQRTAGQGFGLTWPAAFPVARIDQILVRGATPTASSTLPRTGSDHLPVAAAACAMALGIGVLVHRSTEARSLSLGRAAAERALAEAETEFRSEGTPQHSPSQSSGYVTGDQIPDELLDRLGSGTGHITWYDTIKPAHGAAMWAATRIDGTVLAVRTDMLTDQLSRQALDRHMRYAVVATLAVVVPLTCSPPNCRCGVCAVSRTPPAASVMGIWTRAPATGPVTRSARSPRPSTTWRTRSGTGCTANSASPPTSPTNCAPPSRGWSPPPPCCRRASPPTSSATACGCCAPWWTTSWRSPASTRARNAPTPSRCLWANWPRSPYGARGWRHGSP